MFPINLILVQRLMGQQETVVQHIQLSQKANVHFHLIDKPGFLPTCSNNTRVCIQYVFTIASCMWLNFFFLQLKQFTVSQQQYKYSSVVQCSEDLPKPMCCPSKLLSFSTLIICFPPVSGLVHLPSSQPLMSNLCNKNIYQLSYTHKIFLTSTQQDYCTLY